MKEIFSFSKYMLLTDRNNKLISSDDGVLGLHLYIAVGLPLEDRNGDENVWCYWVTHDWVADNINKIVNVNISNGSLYTLKNIKGTRKSLPRLSDEAYKHFMDSMVKGNIYDNTFLICCTKHEFKNLELSVFKDVNKDWYQRLKVALGTFINGGDAMKAITNVMYPWYYTKYPDIVKYEGDELFRRAYSICKETLYMKLHCLLYLYYNKKDMPVMDDLYHAYNDLFKGIRTKTVTLQVSSQEGNRDIKIKTSNIENLKNSVESGKWNGRYTKATIV